jgi:hypothetical protein
LHHNSDIGQENRRVLRLSRGHRRQTVEVGLDAVEARLAKHIVCTPAQRVILTLYPPFTHVHAQFPFFVRVAVSSPEPECGKSTTLKILALLCYRVVDSDDINAANLRRMKEAYGSITLVLDEITDVIAKSDELDTILRSGFERGRRAIRLVKDSAGNLVHEEYPVDMPAVVAGLTTLRGALSTRCLHIRLQPKPADLEVEDVWTESAEAALLKLSSKLARWAQDSGTALTLQPQYPSTIRGRKKHCSQALLSIAEQAGTEWAEKARAAVVELLGDSADFNEVPSQILLRDIRAIFTDLKVEELSSRELVTKLHGRSESAWDGSDGSRAISQYRLASMLRPYNILPGMTGPTHQRVRGYRRDQFLKPDTVFSSRTPPEGAQVAHFEGLPGFRPDQTAHAVQPEQQSAHQPEQPKAAENSQNVHPVHPVRSVRRSPEKTAETEVVFGDGLDTGSAAEGPLLGLVRSQRRDHPDWSPQQIAKALKQPVARVQRALNEIGEAGA